MQRLLGLAVLGVLVMVGAAQPNDARAAESNGVAPQRSAPLVDEPHVPPVDAVIIDPFRLPEFDWQPGNRGLEYDTFVGQTVRASGPGVVTFSGQVGGTLFVTVRHSAELRTTVGFVTETLVTNGTVVRRGDAIAIAGHTMHFTARLNGRYIDPELLFQRYRTVVRLVERPGG